ncbi:GntR family transcriptional regulator [Rhodospirillum sp. A1_3_36]|uniref:GntR family transcriptional regulator n=1 Tax=Rhodospirillum sp. A1_3_36 TaxID=3391666 RepID=UPI0039A590EF
MASSTAEWTIDRGLPVGPQLYRVLRERIIRNDFPPGTRLSEAELALAFSVSRQPVREAFIKLAEEKLLEIRPQRGSFVRRISRAAVMDARFMREAVEADVAKLLAQSSDRALVVELRRQLTEQRAVGQDNPLRFCQLDERFHQTLMEACGKAHAWRVLETLKAQMDRVRFLSFMVFPMEKLITQHTALVDAIEVGDPLAAEAVIRGHLREILEYLPKIEREMPESFDDEDRSEEEVPPWKGRPLPG